MSDTTSRPCAEELDAACRENVRLRADVETYRQLFDHARDILYRTDAHGYFTQVNPIAALLLGCAESEIFGRHYLELVHSRFRRSARRFYERQFAGRIANTYYEFPASGKNDREIWVGQNVQLLEENGEVVGFQAVARDITARREAEAKLKTLNADLEARVQERTKELAEMNRALQVQVAERIRSEKALSESEARFRVLFADNPQPMWVYLQRSLAIVEVNDAAVNHYGYSRDEFLRMTLSDLHLPEDMPALLESIARNPRGVDTHGTWKQRKKDGSVRDMELTSHGLMFAKQRARLVLGSDVTERKRLEQRMEQTQRMESIGRLAGGLAHDFNNLLTVISGNAELALAETHGNQDAYAALMNVHKASARAAELTRKLLTIARDQVIEPAVFQLNELILNLDAILRRVVGSDVQVVTLLEAEGDHIYADPGQIEQVLLNLVINARDAMPQGGKLLIETADIVFSGTYAHPQVDVVPGEYVMLSVSDTGTGMDEDTQQRIFEPFFTTKEPGKGTGLGLATCHGIVKQSGGTIWVYSEKGRGTTFKIFLPSVSISNALVAKNTAPVTIPMGTETVLVVDDDEQVREFTAGTLRALGYTALTAEDGVDALRIAESGIDTIRLVITDLVMPNFGGRELVELLRVRMPRLSVLYISGYTGAAAQLVAAVDSRTAFLQKPYTPATLARKVRMVLDEDLALVSPAGR